MPSLFFATYIPKIERMDAFIVRSGDDVSFRRHVSQDNLNQFYYFTLLMSALTNAEIPTIDTFEKLAAYVGITAAVIQPTLETLEASASDPVKVADSSIIKAADGSTRILLRLSIAFDPNYAVNTANPLWQNALEWSNVAIPAAYKA